MEKEVGVNEPSRESSPVGSKGRALCYNKEGYLGSRARELSSHYGKVLLTGRERKEYPIVTYVEIDGYRRRYDDLLAEVLTELARMEGIV